ncbi:hypothetical protein ACQBAR_01065 [Propionibacteriaceae bacterium Y1685]
MDSPVLKRRALFALTAGAGAAALTGLPPTLAQAALPTSKRFPLASQPSDDFFRHKVLKGNRVQQSFAFDDPRKAIFVAQLKDGSSDASGDLTITRLKHDGSIYSYMHVLGAGHGVNIAAEPDGKGGTYLWTEAEGEGASARGTRLARFLWKGNTTVDTRTSAVQKFDPVAGATNITPSIDPINNRLSLRYDKSGMHVAVFDLAKARAGTFTPLLTIKQPSSGTGITFQGWTVLGQYLYTLEGNSYEATGGKNNAWLHCFDLNTGTKVESFLTGAAASLNFREPEGLAIQVVSGNPRLVMGFASGVAGDRRCNLLYKDSMV